MTDGVTEASEGYGGGYEVSEMELISARHFSRVMLQRGSEYLWIRHLREDVFLFLLPWSYGGVKLGLGRSFRYFDDEWCYDAEHVESAWRAVLGWDGTGEPRGWTRHAQTGRRRPDGTVATEYVSP